MVTGDTTRLTVTLTGVRSQDRLIIHSDIGRLSACECVSERECVCVSVSQDVKLGVC